MAPGEAIATTGEHVLAHEHGVAEMGNGRLSVARTAGRTDHQLPFNTRQLARLDEALTVCTKVTGLAFSIYVGELGPDSRARAEEMLASTTATTEGVLIAVSPGQRIVEVVTGTNAQRRVADRGARLAVMAMVAAFRDGDLVGGLLSALRMLADQAGPAPR